MLDINQVLNNAEMPSDADLRGFFGKKAYAKYQKIFLANDGDTSKSYLELAEQIKQDSKEKYSLNLQDVLQQVLPYILAAKSNPIHALQIYNTTIRFLHRNNTFGETTVDALIASLKNKITEIKTQPIEVNDISNTTLKQLISDAYSAKDTTLAQRLDLQYQILKTANTDLANPTLSQAEQFAIKHYQQKADEFLQFILETNDPSRINELMRIREKNKPTNPEYIPGIEPIRMPTPSFATSTSLLIRGLQNEKLQKENKLLAVNDNAKEKDEDENTILLTKEERDDFRVVMHGGKIYERTVDNTFELVDTKNFAAKIGEGYAAFTVNNKGEFSLFDHLEGDNNLFHSSTNAQAYVFAAGEIKIENGQITALTNTSGHYRPTLDSTIALLNYLQDRQVDISKIHVTIQTPTDQKEFNGLDLVENQAAAKDLSQNLSEDVSESSTNDNDDQWNAHENINFDDWAKTDEASFDNSATDDNWATFDNVEPETESDTNSESEVSKNSNSDAFSDSADWADFNEPTPILPKDTTNKDIRRSSFFSKTQSTPIKENEKEITEKIKKPSR